MVSNTLDADLFVADIRYQVLHRRLWRWGLPHSEQECWKYDRLGVLSNVWHSKLILTFGYDLIV